MPTPPPSRVTSSRPRSAPPPSPSSSSRSRFWRHRKFDVHYETVKPSPETGCKNGNGLTPSGPHADVVFVAGFGCGSFHFHRNMESLARRANVRCYAMDIVGQGKSWPVNLDDMDGHTYNAEGWVHQLGAFIDEVVHADADANDDDDDDDGRCKRPLYLVGNSLGGYLVAATAARDARRLRGGGVVLLNATPFWGSTAVLPWKGVLPVPRLLRTALTGYWDFFRSEANITNILSLVYARKEALEADSHLIRSIREPSDHPHALDAFCSILTSPALDSNKSLTAAFDAALIELGEYATVVQINGREDPWVVPAWGRRAKRLAPPNHRLVEISPCGHCPHHETPETVNELLTSLIVEESIHSESLNRAAAAEKVKVEEITDGTPETLLGHVFSWLTK